MNQLNCTKDRQMNSKMSLGFQLFIFLFAPMLLLASCGGGGGGGSPSPSTITGALMDGYITGATVCLEDSNNKGFCDPSVTPALTGVNGQYTLTIPAGKSLGNLNVIARIPTSATDLDNLSIISPYQMMAPAAEPTTNINPLTNLVALYMEATGTSAQSASVQVANALGFTALGLTTTNLSLDYVSGVNANNKLHNMAEMVNTVIQNSNLANPTSLNTASGIAALQASLNIASGVVAPNAATAYNYTGNISTLLGTVAVDAHSDSGSLITYAPPTSYTNADNLALFNQLNTIRQNAGAGLVVQNTSLDTAAANHASYLVNNNLVNTAYLNSTFTVSGVPILGGHYEDSTKPGYTGTTPLDRATTPTVSYPGNPPTIGELLSFGSLSGAGCAASIENSVYHLIEIISPFLEVGLSYNNPVTGGTVCDIELGMPDPTGQFPPSGSWVFYPANGQIGVPPTFYNHAESPVPAPDLQTAGHPIVISLYNQTNTSLAATDIVLNTFTLTLTSAGTPVTTRVLAQSGVGGAGLTTDNNIPAPGVLVLLPTSPLSPNTKYTVTFSASVKGVAVLQSWSFTTGP